MQAGGAIGAGGDRPRLSIIITNYNYGQFVSTAIDSALNQTSAPHEVVVVDDGSTDGSAEVLASYGSRIVLVRQPNLGQAAAFEAGFARSSGEIIVFLDADDALRREAVETIVSAWSSGIAGLCYGLELIDRLGTSIGIYPVTPLDIDLRPALAETGIFPFMPTSGNALAREVVAACTPFPKARWRISADAYLLRMAALAGRIVPIPQVLGYYRIHQANNYFTLGAPETWLNRRGLTQKADLGAELGARPTLPGADKDTIGPLALSLLLSGLHADLDLVTHGERRPVGRRLIGAALRALGSDAPLLPRVGMSALWLVLATGLWRWPAVRRWLRDPFQRPELVRDLLVVLGRRAIARYLAKARLPRNRAPLFNRSFDLTALPRRFELLGLGWSSANPYVPPRTDDRLASLRFRLEPTPDPLILIVDLRIEDVSSGRQIEVEAVVEGSVTARTVLNPSGTLEVMFPQGFAALGREVEVWLKMRSVGRLRLRQRLAQLRSAPLSLRLERVWLGGRDSLLDPPGISNAVRRAFRELIGTGQSNVWAVAEDGSVVLTAGAGTIRFAAPAHRGRILMRLGVPEGQPRGWMRISAGTQPIYAGEWGASRQLWCRLPGLGSEGPVVHELAFAFTGDDLTAAPDPSLATVTFFFEGFDPFAGIVPPEVELDLPPVNAGQVLTFAPGGLGRTCLLDGWKGDSHDAATLTADVGEMQILVPLSVMEMDAILSIVPGIPAPDGYKHLLVVTSGEILLAHALLQGPSELKVGLGPVLSTRKGRLVLGIRSTFVRQTGTPVQEPGALDILFAPLTLKAVRFAGTDRPEALGSVPPRQLATPLDAALTAARELLGTPEPALRSGELALLRERALAALEKLDTRGLHSTLNDPGQLSTMVALGRMLGSRPAEQNTGAAPAAAAPDLRRLLAAIMTVPASAVPELRRLDSLPAPLLWNPSALAAYLGADPHLHPEDEAGYRHFIRALLESIDAALAGAPRQSALYRLAFEALRQMRPQFLLMMQGSLREHALQFARTLERVLIGEGFALFQSFDLAARQGERLRVGIITRGWRPVPESWIVKAMLEGLDKHKIEAIPIFVASGESFTDVEHLEGEGAPPANAIYLAGTSIGEQVDAIRGLELDIVILGAFVFTWDRLTAIVAHKLAPIQAITTAISPITTGLSSFDTVLSSALIEPEDAAEHYTESLVLMQGPVQCFSSFATTSGVEAERPSVYRRRNDLPFPAFQFVSGAMMHKIGPQLLSAWLEILRRVPGSVLVLYPYARNWRSDFATDAFEHSLAQALQRAGLDPDRIIVRRDLSPGAVRDMLRASDLYLDSFPYAGATTVTEALECGLPVVALRGRHQRARQGAGWLAAAGLDEDATGSPAEYVDRAVAIAGSAALLAERRQKVRDYVQGGPVHADVRRFGAEFSQTLLQLAKARGLSISPAEAPPDSRSWRYFFHHVPKTAGTSVLKVFGEWFTLREDNREPWATSNFPTPLDLTRLASTEMPFGHFDVEEMRLGTRYPEIFTHDTWRLISFLRDPLERSLSKYFFERTRRRTDPGYQRLSLSEYLRAATNQIAYVLNANEENWKEVLDQYWFIGTVERLPECVEYLAAQLDKPVRDVPLENASPRHEQPSPEDVDTFMSNNGLDYAIYNEVRRRLDERLGAMPAARP